MTFNGNHNSRIYSPDPPPSGGMFARIGNWVKDLFQPAPLASTGSEAFGKPAVAPFPLLNDEMNEARARRTAHTAASESDNRASIPTVALYPDRTSQPGH